MGLIFMFKFSCVHIWAPGKKGHVSHAVWAHFYSTESSRDANNTSDAWT